MSSRLGVSSMSAKKALNRLKKEGPTPNPYKGDADPVTRKLKSQESFEDFLSDKPKKKAKY